MKNRQICTAISVNNIRNESNKKNISIKYMREIRMLKKAIDA